SYDLTLNTEGKEVNRTRLPRANAQFARMAAGPWVNGNSKVPGFGGPAITLGGRREEAGKLPAVAGPRPAGAGGPPPPQIRAGEWNNLDVIVDADMVWTSL